MSDTAFLAALERIEEAQEPEPKKEQSSRHAHVPNSNNRRSSNANRRRSAASLPPQQASQPIPMHKLLRTSRMLRTARNTTHRTNRRTSPALEMATSDVAAAADEADADAAEGTTLRGITLQRIKTPDKTRRASPVRCADATTLRA